MKKCPTCEKTFEDSMRFCQVDGTPLVDDAPAFDPYATIVAQPITPKAPEEAVEEPVAEPAVEAAEEPALEPPVETVEEPAAEFHLEEVESVPDQSLSASVVPIAEPEDVLDLPQSDPLKTMYVSEDEMRAALGGDATAEAGIIDLPPIEELPAPEPPSFTVPDVPAPNFGDMSPYSASESASEESIPAPPVFEEPETDLSAYDEATEVAPPRFSVPDAPAPSFGDMSPPPSPFSTSESVKDDVVAASPVFDEPKPEPPPFDEAATVIQPDFSSPFDPPPPAPVIEWEPPPAPDSSWQNQEIGSNTPFQPPLAGAAGPSSILAIVSLILGILGLLFVIPTLIFILCGILPFFLGIGAAITGFLARSRASSSPDEYGGKGMATVGIVLGVLDVIAPFAWFILTLLLWGGLAALGSLGS